MIRDLPRTPWQPILTGDLAERAQQAIDEIAADLRRIASDSSRSTATSWSRRGPSLAGGDAGLACFFAYLDPARPEAQPGESFGDFALELLERAIEGTGAVQSPPSLYGGFSGVAWTLEHLRGRVFEDEEGGEDPGEEVAAAILEYLGHTPWVMDYDLISGLVGFGVYALERGARRGGPECLAKVMARLSEIAVREPEGITWHTPAHLVGPVNVERYPEGNFNVGVAHGVPGVIGFLGEACAAGVEEARPLLSGAVSWLLRQKLPEGAGSVFPYSVAPGVEPGPSRLAWCYGDLGITLSLLLAARAVGQEDWEREALALGRACAARTLEASGTVDAGVCHGMAGNAHLFNRLAQATGDPLFAEAARTWFLRTLDQRRPGEGLGGYLLYVADEEGALDWREEPGFLTGVAGLGLSLLGATTPVEPEWDRLLLVSVPPRAGG
ncbi:MAG TPA: lanthionine synthetase C family protein [Thermoanaerobaculia bacterium]|nr:lanthionine synthetase C family protein [Thermoanaerobaculia bacterium]